ncbi:MAG TPA: ABC transporter ATP-binding protein [Planctomycetota bacterium]|jgi:ABC-2 type transport system ATP-binding protein|nr:ABC transporter ATP-binding protein [Planctomycetota bacterium]
MIIELDAVTKHYGGVRALDGLSATLSEGVIGLLGPNGAGKSTLLKVLLGLVRLSSGRARVLGLDARRHSRSIRRQVGYMPEDDCTIAGLSGVQSVAFAGELAGLPPRTALRRAHEMLDYVGVTEERYREVQTYSTGMKQRVKLAQAIIHAPSLVFLDEPTSGLDPQGRERMLALIRSLFARSRVSVVVSTHILQDVEACCDSVLILAKGRALVNGRLADLRQSVDSSLFVRFAGDGSAFAKALQGLGCAAEPAGPEELRVSGDPQGLPERIFRAARESRAVVRQLAAGRTSLEEIFLKAVTGDRDAHL